MTRAGDLDQPKELTLREASYGDFRAAIEKAQRDGYRLSEVAIIGGSWVATLTREPR